MFTKKQSLLIKKISLLVFFVILFLPQISLGAINTLKPAGAECGSANDESCVNKECETADDGKYYCTCDADSDCPLTTPTDTGLGSFGETWDCVNGSDRSRGLNYCLSNKGKVEYAIPPKFGQTAKDLYFDRDASTVAMLDEVKNLISAPQPRITIPGLKFSNQDLVKAAIREEGDGTYLYIPYFGEYISAIYSYLVVAISILAVMRILRAGFNWMVFSDQNGIAEAKKHIISAVMGLIIILSSYLILYLINPNLVEFKGLRIKYIKSEFLDPPENEQFNPEDYDTPNNQALNAKYNIQKPSWTHRTFNCAQKYSYQPTGVVDPKILKEVVIKQCPGLIGAQSQLVPEMATALCKAGAVAQAQGYQIRVGSSYRPFKEQVDLWCNSKDPVDERRGSIATPGFSNHGHGKAVDIYLAKDGKAFFGASVKAQCGVSELYIGKLAEIMYTADPNFVRLSTEIWHFEYGTNDGVTRGKFLTMPEKCKAKK